MDIVTKITVGGKNAFIFNPANFPLTVSIGRSQFFCRNIDDLGNNKDLAYFKEEILKLIQRKNDV